ncbi:MAG: phage terminase large subunit, partial [bacterium]|nr:phage terminase large subunit [bacterium]
GYYHVVSAYRARLSFEEQFQTTRSLFALHDRPAAPVMIVGVEANSYQEALAQRLRSETMVPVRSITQTRDKHARAMRMQGLFQTGRIKFQRARPDDDGVRDLIEELLAFPDADHDDLVDALEIAMRMAREASRYGELPMSDPEVGP